jgi:hypothetical protein
MMSVELTILGLKKAAIVLHSLAFGFKCEKTRQETLSLIDSIESAIRLLEKQCEGML